MAISEVPMAATLQSLSATAKCSIFVDGAPDPGTPLLKFELEDTVGGILDRIAHTCDYAWTQHKSGVILMGKRFAHPASRPQMNRTEMIASLRDAMTLIGSIPHGGPDDWTKPIRQLYGQLSPEQLAALQGGTSLDSTRLSRQQLELVFQAVHTRVLGGIEADIQRALTALESPLNSRLKATSFSTITANPPLRRASLYHLFGPDSSPVVSQLGEIEEQRNGAEGEPKLDTLDADQPLHPNNSVKMGLDTLLSAKSGRISTAKFAEWMEGATGLKFEVAQGLQERRVMVLLSDVTTKNALDSLCSLLDWQWAKRDETTIRIVRRKAPTPKSLSNLVTTMLRSFPRDVQTLLGSASPVDDPRPAPADKDMTSGASRANVIASASASKLGKALSHRLFNGENIAVSTLDPRQYEDWTAALVFHIFRPFDQLLWSNGRGMHKLTTENVRVRLDQGNILLIWGEDKDGVYAGFGANIK